MSFEQYTASRKESEFRVKAAIMSWAKAETHEDITIGQITCLEQLVISALNQATREAFELGQASINQTSTQRPLT